MTLEEQLRKQEEAAAKKLESDTIKMQSDEAAKARAQENFNANMQREQELKAAADFLASKKIPQKADSMDSIPARIGRGYSKSQLEEAKALMTSQRTTAGEPVEEVSPQANQAITQENPIATQQAAQPSPATSLAKPDYGFGLAKQGLMLQAKAEEDALKAQEEGALAKKAFLDAEIEKQAQLQQKRNEELSKVQSEVNALEEDYANTKITNPDIWGQSSTGGKILLALGALLSSASNQGAQAFRQGIKDRIDRDIELQKANLAKKRESIQGKKGLYAQMKERYQDDDLANAATRNLYLNSIETDLQAKLANAKTPQAQAKLKLALSELAKEQQIAKDNFTLKALDLQNKMGKGAQAKELNSSDKARKDNIDMALRAITDVEKALKSGVSTISVKGDNRFTLAAREFAEAIGRMQSGGAINKDEEKRFRAMLPETMDDDEIRFIKIQRAKDMLESRLRTLGLEAPSDIKAKQEAELGIR